MNHKTYENWLQYVNDELEEVLREEYENHLYSCDHCLELYLQAVEANEFQMPNVSETSTFTDEIMLKLNKPESHQEKEIASSEIENKRVRPSKKHKNKRKEMMIHYTLAAAMTLILMSTGVFSQLMNLVGEFEDSDGKPRESFIYSFLNNASSITEQLEDNLKEGDKK